MEIPVVIIWAAGRAFRYSPDNKNVVCYGGQGASSGCSCPPASHTFLLSGAATSIAAAVLTSMFDNHCFITFSAEGGETKITTEETRVKIWRKDQR